MTIDTTDVRSNAEAQILHAVKVIGRSEVRRKVFEEIYTGKSNGKTAEQIASKTGLTVVSVLQATLVLYNEKVISETKIDNRLTFIKDRFYSSNRNKILRRVENEVVKGKNQREKVLVSSSIESRAQSSTNIKIKPSSRRNSASTRRGPNSITVLFLAANPKETVTLRLDEEVREIEHKIWLAQKKDELKLEKRGAVRASDLQFYLNQVRPTIVHFSGHGTEEGQIVLEDNNGNPFPVPSEALASVFETLKDNVRCIVLNACFSFEQAQAINRYIDFVIGISSSIDDQAAIAFSYGFYLGLASERSIENAFKQGINEMKLLGFSGVENMPKLLCRDNVDPSKVFLLPRNSL